MLSERLISSVEFKSLKLIFNKESFRGVASTKILFEIAAAITGKYR
jgi:hypothetical protein